MKQKEMNKVITDALLAWGTEAQIDMAIEEMAELILALQKLGRKRGKSMEDKIIDVQSEIADVTAMMMQMRQIFGPEEVDKILDFKMNRVKKRLESPEKGN